MSEDDSARTCPPPLRRADLLRNGIQQFDRWFQEMLAQNPPEPNATTLATAGASGAPTARIVLLKGYDEDGFVFFTNYQSRKGRDLAENPRAALVFFWPLMNRQVRVTGSVQQLSAADSDAYFHSRPIGSQLGAWASTQSEVLPDRLTLERRLAQALAHFPGTNIPRPEYWGGYRIAPEQIEFWQAQPNRLHDRFLYSRRGRDEWQIERLSP